MFKWIGTLTEQQRGGALALTGDLVMFLVGYRSKDPTIMWLSAPAVISDAFYMWRRESSLSGPKTARQESLGYSVGSAVGAGIVGLFQISPVVAHNYAYKLALEAQGILYVFGTLCRPFELAAEKCTSPERAQRLHLVSHAIPLIVSGLMIGIRPWLMATSGIFKSSQNADPLVSIGILVAQSFFYVADIFKGGPSRAVGAFRSYMSSRRQNASNERVECGQNSMISGDVHDVPLSMPTLPSAPPKSIATSVGGPK